MAALLGRDGTGGGRMGARGTPSLKWIPVVTVFWHAYGRPWCLEHYARPSRADVSRIATRHEKTDKRFAAIINLVATVLWTR
jgi:hypothetical protein